MKMRFEFVVCICNRCSYSYSFMVYACVLCMWCCIYTYYSILDSVYTIATAFHSSNFELRKLFDKIEWIFTRILHWTWFFTNSIGLDAVFAATLKLTVDSKHESMQWKISENFIKIVIIWFQHRWNSNKLWILLHSYTYMQKDVSVITFINRLYNGIATLL